MGSAPRLAGRFSSQLCPLYIQTRIKDCNAAMRRAGTCISLIGLLAAAAPAVWAAPDQAKPPAAAPDFQEVYQLISAHLAGVNSAELNRTAVQALVGALSPAVSLVSAEAEQQNGQANGPLLEKSSLFDGAIAYFRIGRVEDGLAEAIRGAYKEFATNQLNGVVIDLRFARGKDYAAAGKTADLFLRAEKPLLDWGSGSIRSTEKTDAIRPPVAVLVNGETACAAEALAAAFRETGAGLIVGGKTAGQAMLAQEYPLKNGQRLRIATTPIKVGEATLMSAQGVKPDLAVEVSRDAERAYLADPFKELLTAATANPNSAANGAAGTNRTRRPRFSEAELVRERREGLPPDFESSERGGEETEKPVVRDPALARALDVLKGLAVVRPRT